MGKEMEQLWNEQMKELLVSQLRQITQDEDWISQIVNVDSMRKLGLLLKEKQIHPEEFKRALAAAALKNSNRTLTDQQLESVSGGGYESLCT